MASRMPGNRRIPPALGQLAVALCFFGLPGLARAVNNCPWINEATVSGLLQGEAAGAFVEGSAGQPSTCSFVHKTASGTRMLTIDVQTMQGAHARVDSLAKGCAQPPEILPAIGNEAFICAPEHGKDSLTERVVGRVRDQVFTIVISTAGKADAMLSADGLKSRISIVSEQVSGNLF